MSGGGALIIRADLQMWEQPYERLVGTGIPTNRRPSRLSGSPNTQDVRDRGPPQRSLCTTPQLAGLSALELHESQQFLPSVLTRLDFGAGNRVSAKGILSCRFSRFAHFQRPQTEPVDLEPRAGRRF